MKTIRLLMSLLIIVVASAGTAQQSDLMRGYAAREEGDLQRAASHFQQAVQIDPRNQAARLALAETLAWMKRFVEAEQLYREVLRDQPRSAAARLGLARALLWQLRLDEAASLFTELASEDPGNAGALSGAAMAAWWGGDWRAARRYARKALEIEPRNEDALHILGELDIVTAPVLRVGASHIDDDQPYRFSVADVGYTAFSDPLTSWTVRAGTYLLDDSERDERSPFVEVSGLAKFPRARLDLSGAAKLLEFPDGTTELLGSVAVAWKTGPASLSVSWERAELLRTRTALDDHPHASTLELRVSRLAAERWTGSGSIRAVDYYDGNRGLGADAWLLTPRWSAGRFGFSVGPAVSYRDTEESRFLPGSPTGIYDPYWTPEDLFEVRGVLVVSVSLQRLVLSLHADGGWGEETVTPEALTREFHPWRATLTADLPIAKRWGLTVSAGREKTAFYDATQVSASVARRF